MQPRRPEDTKINREYTKKICSSCVFVCFVLSWSRFYHDLVNRLALRLTLMFAMTATSFCTARPIRVGLAFDNDWQMGHEALTLEEQARVKAVALQTLQDAFRAFDVSVREARDADRLIVVDKGFVAGLRPAGQPAPVGETLPFAWVSRVHFDELCGTLLTVTGCAGAASRCTKTRSELVDGLGRGIGGTAAHELGHQTGLRFALDARCETCYDGGTSNTYEHFFGSQRWSDAALTIMRRVLPPEAPVR